MFLQELNGQHHENIIKLLNVLKADNDKDIYLVFEYMGKLVLLAHTFLRFHGNVLPCLEINLHAVIRANILEEVHKKYILYQTIKVVLVHPMFEAKHNESCNRP